MNSQPPTGSKITLTREGVDEILRIAQPSKGVVQYFAAAFMIFWLGGWFMGFKSASAELMESHGGNTFLAFWLAAWTVGGISAVFFLYRMLMPAVPESFILRSNSAIYDSGVASFQMSFGYEMQKDFWKQLRGKRLIADLTINDLRTLKLRETDSGNRLTIDKDSERFEIASRASEIEREWLHAYLSSRYS
jgi:hypothetical protein